jgi:hypothetical protein
MLLGITELGDEAFELPALDADRAADVDDGQAAAGDLAFDAAPRAAQLARGLVEGEQHGVGCGRGRGAGVCLGLHVAPRDGSSFGAITAEGVRGGTQPDFGGTRWGYASGDDPRRQPAAGE